VGVTAAGDYVAEVRLDLLMTVAEVAFDRRLLDGPVYPLELAIGPRVLHLGEPLLDAIPPAAHVEHAGDL
jgi:hypothetical protein